ncbi:MAG: 50S ribosomal protein L28 [Patescibacteria group bacterium]
MSRICSLTGKRANFGQQRSHSNRATKCRQNVNLQVIRMNGKRVRVSARVLKTLKRLTAKAHEKK